MIIIAEAPPYNGRTYFYKPDDSLEKGLFWQTMLSLFPRTTTKQELIEEGKTPFLEKFCEEGLYLLDAAGDRPLPSFFKRKALENKTADERKHIRKRRKTELEIRIKNHLPTLLEEIEEVAREEVPILLVVKRSGKIIAPLLVANGKTVLNLKEEAILPFPNREELKKTFQSELRKNCKDQGIFIE